MKQIYKIKLPISYIFLSFSPIEFMTISSLISSSSLSTLTRVHTTHNSPFLVNLFDQRIGPSYLTN